MPLSFAMKRLSILFAAQVMALAVYAARHNSSQFSGLKRDTSYHIIKACCHTFGYEIMIGSKTIIRQLTIPGQWGESGFKTSRDAQEIAQLVLKKLQLGIMPPTVDKVELDKLRIDYKR